MLIFLITLQVRNEASRLKVEVDMKTMIGAPMDAVEEVLNAKQEDLKPSRPHPDTKRQINQFLREARKGNHACVFSSIVLPLSLFVVSSSLPIDLLLPVCILRHRMARV